MVAEIGDRNNQEYSCVEVGPVYKTATTQILKVQPQ